MVFVKSSFGPKEGRFPPGLLSPASTDRRRRYVRRRKQILLFATVVLSFILYSTLFRSGVLARLERYELMSSSLQDVRNSVSPETMHRQGGLLSRFVRRKETLKADSENSGSGNPAEIEEGLKAPVTEEPVVKAPLIENPMVKASAQAPLMKGLEQQSAKIQKLGPEPEEKSISTHWTERPDLKNDLDTVFALLPDELTIRELLRPINDGGASRMRELGLRTRAYQKYLSAWEKLHLVEDKQTGETYIRDDLIQYLRGTQHGNDANSGMSLTDTIHNYEAFRAFLAGLANLLFPFTSPYFADHMTLHAQFKNGGRGIVLTAGDDQAHYLLTTIYALRKIGCDLPIEVMYLGDTDLGEDHRIELENLPGVITRDIAQMVDDTGWKLAGWAIKPFAMLLSSFREVIFIDADSFFFRDPEILFDDADYVESGALFFRDRTIMPESKRRWLQQVLPRPIPKLAKESSWWKGTSGHHQESGVVVVDKWRHFVSMLLVCRFNGSDRDGRGGRTGVYEMMHGDKETFWIGFLLAGDESFAFHRGAVGIMGSIQPPQKTEPDSSDLLDLPLPEQIPPKPKPQPYKICSPQLLHLDQDNKPLWFNGWLLESKYADAAERRFAVMETYLVEPRDGSEFWELGEDNVCCLTAELRGEISGADLDFLGIVRGRVVEVGGLG